MTNITTPLLAVLATLFLCACYRSAPTSERDKPVIETIHLETRVTVTTEPLHDTNASHALQPSREVSPCR
jgi:hypothetical protein